MREFNLAKGSKTVIGMVHCLPLPGTAGFSGNYQEILDHAVEDAVTLEKAGVDAVIVENMGDTPFSALLDKAQVVALTAAATKVREAVKIPVGIDAAFNDCEASLAIAGIVGADFIRVPVFVDTVLFSDGIIYPCARKCMNYRKAMGLEHVKILADVQVKHATMLSSQITVEMSAKDAVSNGADAIIVTGAVIGAETPIDMLQRVQKVVNVPLLAGSGGLLLGGVLVVFLSLDLVGLFLGLLGIAHALAQVLHGLAQSATEFWQILRAEDKQNDDQDDKQLGNTHAQKLH